jgi:hypothetical protein
MVPRKPDSDRWSFLQTLATGLRQQPAYLLIFAISALFFLLSLGSGVSAAFESKPQLWYLAFGGLLASLIAAVIVVRNVQTQPSPPLPPPEPTRVHTLSPRPSGDQSADEVLYAIHENVNKALAFRNDTFREAVLRECDDFRARSADWSEGRMLANVHYNQLLMTFYERAKESVFSTNIPNYLSTWSMSFGDQLMAAHGKSNATINRIFVFNKRDDVTPEAFSVMEKQCKAGINVRLYFSDESRVFSFPTDISKDFTVIDHGEAIGTTISFGGDSLAAEWYIQDKDRKRRFEGICRGLTLGSEDFSKFSQWWKENKLTKA